MAARIWGRLVIVAIMGFITAGLAVVSAEDAQAAPFANWIQLGETQAEIVAIAESYEAKNGVSCTVTGFTFHEIPPDPELGIPGDTFWSAEITCFE